MVDFRRDVRALLAAAGYVLVEQESFIEDPFKWKLVAEKDGYQLCITESPRETSHC